jgi:FMN phosphatase YigB (HAD superfamily)
VAYVGDRVDNDVRPARAAGMHAVWIRRGPWGEEHEDADGAADLVVRSLDELVQRIGEVWAD